MPSGLLDRLETLLAGCWEVSPEAPHWRVIVAQSCTDNAFLPSTGYKEPLVYNWKVFTSLCRQVYIAEKLAPPTSLSTWVHAYAKIWSQATSPAYYRQIAQNGEWSKVAVYVSHSLRDGQRGQELRFIGL